MLIKGSVGACIVYQEPHHVVSVGYNGFVDGLSDGYGIYTLPNAVL